jgi:hypothetical protein
MDDIAVIIISFIIMVAGAIGQAKKKKGHAVKGIMPPQRPNPLNGIF